MDGNIPLNVMMIKVCARARRYYMQAGTLQFSDITRNCIAGNAREMKGYNDIKRYFANIFWSVWRAFDIMGEI